MAALQWFRMFRVPLGGSSAMRCLGQMVDVRVWLLLLRWMATTGHFVRKQGPFRSSLTADFGYSSSRRFHLLSALPQFLISACLAAAVQRACLTL